MKKKVICAVLICSMILSACGNTKKDEEKEEVISVDVVSPQMTDVSVSGDFMGTLEPQEETSVIPKMSGEVTNTYFEVGDHVEAGELLFTLDDEAAKMQVENAEATYDTAAAGAKQSLGGIDLQRSSAENDVANADSSIKSVLNSCDGLSDSYSDAQDQIDDLKDNKEDLEDASDKAASYYGKVSKVSTIIGKLNSLASQYASAIANNDQDEANQLKEDYNTYYSQITGGNTTDDPSASHSVEYNTFISETTGNPALTIEGLSAELASARSAMTSADTALSSVSSGIDSLESQQDSINNSKESMANSYDQAVRGKGLAEKSLDYYNNYTAPGTQETTAATLKQAQVGVDSAKLQLDYTQIKAPVSGVIEQKNVDPFDMAQAGMAAYVITNKDNMVANFKVTESVLNTLEIGQAVTVERNGKIFEGSISELPLTIDDASGLFVVKATVNGSPDELISGTSVKVTTTTDHVEKALSIPVDCVYYDSTSAYVYVSDQGVIKKIYVETGIFNDENIQILSGITEDVQVVTTWTSELRDGLEVSANHV